MSEKTLFDDASLAIGGTTSAFCCLFGTTINGMVMFTILKRSKDLEKKLALMKTYIFAQVLFLNIFQQFKRRIRCKISHNTNI